MNTLMTLWYYWRARQLHFTNRQQLEHYQQRQLQRFCRQVLAKSPYFKPVSALPLTEWPLMDKAVMMDNFNRMNTAGLNVDELLACAQRSETERDFTPKVGRYSVGLSTGTSGRRGVFVVSEREQQHWAGMMLAKMLPESIFAGERIALFLRADNNLYQTVNNRWLSLTFFDLFSPFAEHLPRLQQLQPTIVVGPAQVLCALAQAVQCGQLNLRVKKVISGAEVLEPQDKLLLQQVFADVGEVYQATEGFLAASCQYGTLHLNEEFIYVEPQWLDEERFVPLITDFSRTTQPIVRYRLDDILVARQKPCRCGKVTMALDRIEGRCDDQLALPARDGSVQRVFADLCRRVIANALPAMADYRFIQRGNQLQLLGDCDLPVLENCRQQLIDLFQKHDIALEKIHWQVQSTPILPQFDAKRRRIVRMRT
ncbi:CoF synthetase [Snodgrassella alvi]|uniref:F390 synthetase-related protein n=1 Tax=Snodgrassella alvi TaxID=1196083 RepID=UPI000C1F2E1A|nr:F390 synthetase-related protein [Snodgrassella alvi]PIT13479.1 CoF synthetase [Snodgrassella alvi]PIT54664.1 CoF synthetase [Snodgrassella alvi]